MSGEKRLSKKEVKNLNPMSLKSVGFRSCKKLLDTDNIPIQIRTPTHPKLDFVQWPISVNTVPLILSTKLY